MMRGLATPTPLPSSCLAEALLDSVNKGASLSVLDEWLFECVEVEEDDGDDEEDEDEGEEDDEEEDEEVDEDVVDVEVELLSNEDERLVRSEVVESSSLSEADSVLVGSSVDVVLGVHSPSL